MEVAKALDLGKADIFEHARELGRGISRNVTVRRGPSAGASMCSVSTSPAWAEPGRAELPLPTWCQKARVPLSMIIRR